jgi:hypothetical protein
MAQVQPITMYEYDNYVVKIEHQSWKDKPWKASIHIYYEGTYYGESRQFTTKSAAKNFLRCITEMINI